MIISRRNTKSYSEKDIVCSTGKNAGQYSKKHTGSIMLTVLIYGLFLYLSAGILQWGIQKWDTRKQVVQVIKTTAFSEIKTAEYFMTETFAKGSNNQTAGLLVAFVKDPLSEFQDSFPVDGRNREKNINCVFELPGEQTENTGEKYLLSGENQMMKSEYTGDYTDVWWPVDGNKTDGEEKETCGQDEKGQKDASGEEKTQTDISGSQNAQETAMEGGKPQEQPGSVSHESADNLLTDSLKKVREIDRSLLTYEYLMKNYYTVVSSTTLRPEDIDAGRLMNMDMKMKTPPDSPQILIYHTHGQEGFTDSVRGKPETGIVGVGNYLTDLLTTQYGYHVLHITDSFDYVNGVLDRSKAYDYAYEKIAAVLAENPSIEVVIDLHRDGVGENTHLVTEVGGKQTAQIMFFNGISRLNDIGEIGYLYNPYRSENLALSLQMKVLAEEYFPGFTRRNYIQAYQYNLHLRPKSMLIEAGAQTNTFEEVKNAMEPLAALLHLCLG